MAISKNNRNYHKKAKKNKAKKNETKRNNTKQKHSEKNVLRYPRLDTVMMVERTIKKYDGKFKKRALWEHLPKKMMYQTFCVIIDYLYPNKVSIDAEGKLGWIYYPRSARRWLKDKHLFWRRED